MPPDRTPDTGLGEVGMVAAVKVIVARSEVRSVFDRLRLDRERPELKCEARNEDYRRTLDRAVALLDEVLAQNDT
jgi:hypothetical protein